MKQFLKMKPKNKHTKLTITEADYLLAHKKSARQEEIAAHGKIVSFRKAVYKSKKVYDRKRIKRQGWLE